jgi:hypothetical protein
LEVIVDLHINKVVFNAFHPWKTLSSLGYLGLFCIIDEWIFPFGNTKTQGLRMWRPQHEHGGICCAFKYKHEDGCMPNFKHKEYFNHTWRSKCSKMLFIQIKASMHATKKRDAFMIHVFPTIDVKSH